MATNNEIKRDDKFKVQWLKLWESEIGKVALQDFKDIVAQLTENAMKAQTQEQAMYFIGRAAGVEYVVEYIEAGKIAGEAVEKEAHKKA